MGKNNKKNIKALVVDDEKVVRDFLIRFLSLEAVEVKAVEDGFKAIEAAKREKFDIVFFEIKLRDMDSFKVLRELKKINPHSKYVMMTASYIVDDLLLVQAKNEGVTACLKKPFEIDEIRKQIAEVQCLK